MTLRDLIISDASILEPLLLFCTHALRMRDSRCCTLITRLLRSILPSFTSPTPPHPQVREFICTPVLKACITSLNEPYFVDVQRDLAGLISSILATYAELGGGAREVLLQLPDMSVARVDAAIEGILGAGGSERMQRGLVLDLLEGVRGVGIHEAGRIDAGAKAKKSALLMQYTRPAVDGNGLGGKRGESPKLEGMAEMFGAE
jgi:exportin-5